MGSIEKEDHPGMTTDLSQLGRRSRTDGPYADNLDIDVLIVGGGFGGIYSMYDMRKAFPDWKIVMYEAGVGYGGVWRFNIYPGARADSPVPIYQLSIPEVDEDFYWKDNYPNWEDLQRYFDHCDKKLNLSKDTAFESVVTGAEFDKEQAKWIVKTADGRTCKTRFLIIAAGFAAKRYFPDYPGINDFKGVIHHSSFWPIGKVDYVGKKFAVIGTGASGVQITQEVGPVVEKLTLYQRTPNLAIPMGKRLLTKEEQDRQKPDYPTIHAYRERNFGGFHYDLCERNTFDDNEEEREKFFHELVWERQGFALWLGGYKDYLMSAPANREAYNYWRRTQSPRVKNPTKRAILFPEEPKHHFGIKRPSLEQNYYEVLDQDNVDVVDVSKTGTPIERFTETGIVTTDGVERQADVVALATGFDVVTGGMTNMGLKSVNGTYLKDEWKSSATTYLGTTLPGYPNLFHLYGAHGPTLLSNGPTCVEVQVRWIRDAIKSITRQGILYINPSQEASREWKERINTLAEGTLFPTTVSTYMGGGLPGKAFEMTCFAGGLHVYAGEIREKLQGWQGFEIVKNEGVAKA